LALQLCAKGGIFKYNNEKNTMKTISHVLLLVIAVASLVACGEQGVGPSKPATQESAK